VNRCGAIDLQGAVIGVVTPSRLSEVISPPRLLLGALLPPGNREQILLAGLE